MDKKKTSFKRFFRFGLRSFFVVTTVFCVWFGIVKTQAKSQSDIVELVQTTGGYCRYDFEFDVNGDPDPIGKSNVPEFLLNLLGVDFFHDVVEVQLYHSNSSAYGFLMNGGSMRTFDNEFRFYSKEGKESAAKVVELLPTLESLRTIALPAMKDLDSAFENFAELERLERITILQGGDLSDRGIASLKDLKHLKKISIEQTQIGDSSLELIGKMKEIEFLYLGGHTFTDKGVKHLAGLDNLSYLCIDGPPRRTRLTVFSLFGGSDQTDNVGEITDEGIQQLLGLKKLKLLSFFHTRATDDSVEKFKAAIPTCQVVR